MSFPSTNGCCHLTLLKCNHLLTAIQHGHVSKFKKLNSAFITLLPKQVDACRVKDFRPISLIHSFAMLVSKILANRLAPLLPSMVSINQSAFIKGRSIHDNFFLVQQMAKCLHARKESHVLLKLDISKAFDSVSWPSLLEVLQQLDFGRFWCNLLCLLLSTSSTRVLINGEPEEVILHRRGLRQGDPLSPMLFILVMDVLSSLVDWVAQEGWLQPLAFRQTQQRCSFFADNVVLFSRPTADDLSVITQVLDIFGHASGLVTNMQKSSITPIRCNEDELKVISNMLPCEVKDFPCSYLGLPLNIKKPSKAKLQAPVDKVADYLPMWKASLMNKAGRLILVRVVLSA